MLLTNEYLYDVVTETPQRPFIKEWRVKVKKARNCINLFICDSQILHIKSQTIPRII